VALLASMELQAAVSHVSFLAQESLGIWFLVWAIRYKADWDFKLSATAKVARWAARFLRKPDPDGPASASHEHDQFKWLLYH